MFRLNTAVKSAKPEKTGVSLTVAPADGGNAEQIDADVVLEADTDVVGHINGGHTAGGALHTGDFVSDEFDPEGASFFAEPLQQSERVEPALAAGAETGAGQSGDIDPGKADGQVVGAEQIDGGAGGGLHGVVFTQGRETLGTRQKQISTFAKT